MVLIDASKLSDEELSSYDEMMIECGLKVEKLSPLAMDLWSEVLRELDLRGLVERISGTYDNLGQLRVRRLYH
jgi:hypothetical protein